MTPTQRKPTRPFLPRKISYPIPADGVTQGIKFSTEIKTIAAQEPFVDLQDRLVGLSEITERIALERKNIMVSLRTKGEPWT